MTPILSRRSDSCGVLLRKGTMNPRPMGCIERLVKGSIIALIGRVVFAVAEIDFRSTNFQVNARASEVIFWSSFIFHICLPSCSYLFYSLQEHDHLMLHGRETLATGNFWTSILMSIPRIIAVPIFTIRPVLVTYFNSVVVMFMAIAYTMIFALYPSMSSLVKNLRPVKHNKMKMLKQSSTLFSMITFFGVLVCVRSQPQKVSLQSVFYSCITKALSHLVDMHRI